MPDLELIEAIKRFGETVAVDRLSFRLEENKSLVLLGPSGCGKTTTLRMIAGFVRPDGGSVIIKGEEVASPNRMVPPERRGLGMVFQNYSIWPHKTVFQNVAYGLKFQKVSKEEGRKKVLKTLDLVQLSELRDRYPGELSGGQQQRVALGRALVLEPKILLLDEPLSNLDALLREEMRFELRDIQRKI
jgi:ABC-type Fe3+/spermidine/putrescine transport system ATPase subunit